MSRTADDWHMRARVATGTWAAPEEANEAMVSAAAKFAHDNDMPAKRFYAGLWKAMRDAAMRQEAE